MTCTQLVRVSGRRSLLLLALAVPAVATASACSSDEDDLFSHSASASGTGAGGTGPGGAGATGGVGPGAGGTGGAAGGAGGCDPGATEACYSGPPATKDVGLCVSGTRTCNPDGTGYGPCAGEVNPVAETCATPGDDDCDGETNEDGAGCTCVPGSQQMCYSGPPTTENVGPCKGGIQSCNAQGTGFGACIGEVLPQPEDCDTLTDDDCSGMANDTCPCAPGEQVPCYEGPPGTANVGACKAGTATCDADGMGFGPCLGQVLPAPDACSSPADDDCSGAAVPCLATWSKSFGATNQGNAPASVATDASGNTFVGFPNTNALDLGSGPESGGAFAKFGPTGTLQWAKTFAGTQVIDIAVDVAGSVLVVGEYSASVNFGGSTLTAPAGSDSVFAAKFDALGSHVWSSGWSAGPSTNSRALSVGVDPVGAVVIGGFFQGTIDFGGGPITAANPTNDLFVVKLAADGAHMWTAHGSVADGAGVNGVSFDPSGNVFASGYFTGSLDLGAGPVPAAGASADLFLAKLAPDGSPLIVKAFGDATGQYGPCYNAVDGAGNVYLVGDVVGTADFGGATIGPGGAGFLAKLDGSANHVFSFAVGDSVRGIDLDAAGNSVVTGGFIGTKTIGGAVLQSTSGSLDVFVAKYGPTGVGQGGERFGDAQSDLGSDVAFDPLGARIVVGEFRATIDFGQGPLVQQGLVDGFVAKLAP